MGELRYGQWEPCDMRVSRTVLGGALGETPEVYSLYGGTVAPIVRTLIYKRTHSGDPNPHAGVFGNHNYMGQVRGWQFDAVIGVGGTGKEPQENGIAGLLTWIGIGANKTGDLRRPHVKFDHFLYFGERGRPLLEIAPRLADHVYGKRVRVMTSSSMSEAELAEVDAILRLARDAPPSGHSKRTKRPAERKKCRKQSSCR